MNDLEIIEEKFRELYSDNKQTIDTTFKKFFGRMDESNIPSLYLCKDESLREELANIVLSTFRNLGFDGYWLSRAEVGLSIDYNWIVDSYDEELFVFENFAIALIERWRINPKVIEKYTLGIYHIPYRRDFIVIPFKDFQCEHCDYEFFSVTLDERIERAKGLIDLNKIGNKKHLLATEQDLLNYFIKSIKRLDGWECERLSPKDYGKGVPDLKVKKPDNTEIFIELKSPQRTGKLSMDQIEYHEKLRDKGETVKIIWQKEQVDKLLAGII